MKRAIRLRLRALPALTSLALLGALVSGCSGGGSALPHTTQSAALPTTQQHKVLQLSRATIPYVMSKLIRSGAYASPMAGQHLKTPRGLHPMTVSAGLNLSYYGGPVVTGANSVNILVNCSDESCWGGQIGTFETDFFGSGNGGMINILDQYTGQTATGAFNDGGDYLVQYNTSTTLGDQDIDNIVYQVATQNNIPTGYGTIFNVFLGSGVQECSQAAGGCYGQQYCAYHGSNDYTDIGHALYTVEPYQGITGCEVSNQPSPNGVLQDSTASTLSHETAETITDPDVAINNVAWYNQTGGEIGDLCAPAAGVPTGNVSLSGVVWEIQMEYDNNISDCSYSP